MLKLKSYTLIVYFLYFLCLLQVNNYTFADFLDVVTEPTFTNKDEIKMHSHFGQVLPLEHNLQQLKPLLNSLTSGVYLSLGTERGFIGAIEANSDYLALIDHRVNYYQYNKANIILLKAISNLAEFNYYKFKTNALTVEKIQSFNISQQEKHFLSLLVESGFWTKFTQRAERHPISKSYNEDNAYKGVNYHFNVENFEKLRTMAIEGRLSTKLVSLSNVEDYKVIVQSFKQSNLKISVLDIANTWEISQLGPASSVHLLREFSQSFNSKSVFLLSEKIISKVVKQKAGDWNYHWIRAKKYSTRYFSLNYKPITRDYGPEEFRSRQQNAYKVLFTPMMRVESHINFSEVNPTTLKFTCHKLLK